LVINIRKNQKILNREINSFFNYVNIHVLFLKYIVQTYCSFFNVFNLRIFYVIPLAYLSLPWPADAPPPKIELYACLVLAGTGIVLLPVLLGAAFLKLGNLANDGIKLGRHLSACSRDPPSSLLTNNPDNSK